MVGLDTDDGNDPRTTMMVWTGSRYNYYDYVSPENAAFLAQEYDPKYASFAGKWIEGIEGDIELVEFPVSKGDGFWIRTTTPSFVFFAGQVYTPTESTISLNSGLNLVANPFPVLWSVHDFTSIDMVGLDTDDSNDPRTTMMVWTGSNYEYCDYVSPENADFLAQEYDEKYLDFAGKWVEWIDGDIELVDFKVAPGKAFWIRTVSSATMKFER